MPTALTLTDISNVVINTTRGSNVDSWQFNFHTIDDVTDYGDIYDNANSFNDTTTGEVAGLKISIDGDTETVALQDFDFLTITGSGGNITSPLVVWLPTLSGDDILYVDTDGNTWYDEELTLPAGGVLAPSDTFTPAEALLVATEFLDDSFTPASAITATIIDSYVSDSVTMNETFIATLKAMTMYFSEHVNMSEALTSAISYMTFYMNDNIEMSEILTAAKEIMTMYFNENLFLEDSVLDTISMAFTEDTQVDVSWTEV